MGAQLGELHYKNTVINCSYQTGSCSSGIPLGSFLGLFPFFSLMTQMVKSEVTIKLGEATTESKSEDQSAEMTWEDGP